MTVHPSQPPPSTRVDSTPSFRPAGDRVHGRYEIIELVGRGGMAAVYRVHDTHSECEVALKQLLPRRAGTLDPHMVAAFEREFATLAQFAHPSVVSVFDYGVDPAGPYYTMELLEGGDLKQLSPLPAEQACALMLQVCSALAMLHARGFVHRDVTPRNLRCDALMQAKLLDFGAVVPIGPCARVVGTPSFVAPEVVHRAHVDGRTDVFSVGATLYFALTGQAPFRASQFSELRELWNRPLPPPSSLAPGVPAALDRLCAALLRIDPAQRPRSVLGPMQQLEAIAGEPLRAPVELSQAYLTTPTLVGREALVKRVRTRVGEDWAANARPLLLLGAPGAGKSRALEACAFEAKKSGATVVQAATSATGHAPLSLMRAVAEQLVQLDPRAAHRAMATADCVGLFTRPALGESLRPLALRAFAELDSRRDSLLDDLSRWLRALCAEQPVAILVDDLHRADLPSLGLLASLAMDRSDGGPSHTSSPPCPRQLLLVATAETVAPAPQASALSVLREHSEVLALAPLTASECEALLKSVFDSAPNLSAICEPLYAVGQGNPRTTLALAQHLVDMGTVRYRDGQWLLPAQLDLQDLPASATEAFTVQIEALPPLARRLAETQALLGTQPLRREDYAALARGVTGQQIDAALLQLLEQRFLRSDGSRFTLGHEGLRSALRASLDDDTRRRRHVELYGYLAGRQDVHPYRLARHAFGAGQLAKALTHVKELEQHSDGENAAVALQDDLAQLADILEALLEFACQSGRPRREHCNLRQRLCALSLGISDDALYERAGRPWLEQLVSDSGLADYQALDAEIPPQARLERALEAATARHEGLSPAERVYAPQEAIRHLVYYVAVSLAFAGRALSTRNLPRLSPLLEPFAPLSPMLRAFWQNAVAFEEAMCRGQRLRARARQEDVHASLGAQIHEVRHARSIRGAVGYRIGELEAMLGHQAAQQWAASLDDDPLHEVSAMRIRRLLALMLGDAVSADKYRRQAELLQLRGSIEPIFDAPRQLELHAYMLARDVENVKRTAAEIASLADRYPGWCSVHQLAQGSLRSLRGEHALAREAFARAAELSGPDPRDEDASHPVMDVWADATAGLIRSLSCLDESTAAIATGRAALERCQRAEMDLLWHGIARELAVAEARAGHGAQARERMQQVLSDQAAHGVRGLELGASYEALARLAVRARDTQGAEKYACLSIAAQGGSTGAAVLARELIVEAQLNGLTLRLAASDFETSVLGTRVAHVDPQVREACDVVDAGRDRETRTQTALDLMVRAADADSGYLFVFDRGGNPTLAAVRKADPAQAEFLAFAKGFLAQRIDDELLTADFTQITETAFGPDVASYVDREGHEHGVLVLTTHEHDTLAFVGLAILRGWTSTASLRKATQFAQALGDALLRTGDGHPVRAQAPLD